MIYGLCEEKGGDLASINSDEEWGFLTAHYMEKNAMSTLLNFWDGSIYFAGLRVKVSDLHFITNTTTYIQMSCFLFLTQNALDRHIEMLACNLLVFLFSTGAIYFY